MTARVVTFSLQIGSGGFEVARAAAQRLNYQYYDSEITSRVAAQVGASPAEVAAALERVPSLVIRIVERLSRIDAEIELTEPSPAALTSSLANLSQDNYRTLVHHLIEELAARGEAVIVGHASQVTLRDKPGTFKVLIYGSVPKRAKRVAEEAGLDEDKARAIVEESDRDRANFFDRIHHIDWLSPKLYDFCLNTDDISLETATDLIVATAQSLPGFLAEPHEPSAEVPTG
jgi:cytidylate kinase